MKALTEKQIRSFKVRMRHERLRELGLCINGPDHDGPSARTGLVHGPVINGGRCARCIEARRRSEKHSLYRTTATTALARG